MPLATAVGTIAAYAGGLADDLSMRVVDVVQTVLPVIAYITTTFVLAGTGSLALMVAVFSLLSWGSVARLVRNDALSRTDEPYVTAAENAGASPWSVVRRHLTPKSPAPCSRRRRCRSPRSCWRRSPSRISTSARGTSTPGTRSSGGVPAAPSTARCWTLGGSRWCPSSPWR
ncbi:hypothetical protein BRD13_03955 [Halobacteriales archaeon SW_5_70_135]|nr:MAG: hypothetical protein BRD13_03955 [Halobacteriales archaeon SW_5_70_135]